LECERNVWDTVNTLRLLGFIIHFEKSSLVPKQKIEFLEFVFNSVNITIFLSDTKAKILKLISTIFQKVKYTIRDIASLLGTFTSTFPGVPYGQLHYRRNEREKISALKKNKGNFDSIVVSSNLASKEVPWWKVNIVSAFQHIKVPKTDLTIRYMLVIC